MTRQTATAMIVAVGEVVQMRAGSSTGEVWVDVMVEDVKFSWGRNRLLVRPVSGDGECWVELTSVRKMADSPVMGSKTMSWREVQS